ncbi:hypothetical protein BB559_000824 [Furculomyces boomerangus]|uniref:Uncharacterized protein n=2 Tax=Harpellales TaxID=61421 RepID=A0A2T9Z3Y4_9FUNG|nr:hypothetical protein BB559_000824 [Furculomyces boomerangus]PVZ98873.1 hypothetical protein BB558_005120 [Smittium angustum]
MENNLLNQTSFKNLSTSRKSQKIKQIQKIVASISYGNPKELYEYFFRHSRFGKSLVRVFLNDFKEKRMVKNILLLYQSLPIFSKKKSNILALVASTYKREELRKFGFVFSNNQYYDAIKKFESGMFSLNQKGQQQNPIKSISDETKELVFLYLENNSRMSSKTCKIKDSNGNFGDTPVFYLEIPKRDVYKKMILYFPEKEIGLSTFNNLSPKNFKKGKKRTNMCPTCNIGKKNVKRLTEIQTPNTETVFLKTQIEKEVEIYNNHINIKSIQEESYKKLVQNLKNGECVLIMDFKENFRLGSGPIKTSTDFYSKPQISNLGFALIVKGTNNILNHES